MTQRVWNGSAEGRYLDGSNWVGGVAPDAQDTWLINGTGGPTFEIDGIYELNENSPLIELYGPKQVPSLIGDPPPSAIPNAAPIVSPDIVVAAGSGVVGFELIDSTIAASTTIDVTGIALMEGAYSDVLQGTINVQPVAGAALDGNGDNSELDIEVFPIGSYDPATFTRRDYTPTVQNAGTIVIGAGSGFDIGLEGAPPELNNLDGILQVLGGYDAFINTGTIALADSSMQVQGGAFAGFGGYNILLNDGLIALGAAIPGANANQDIDTSSGAAFFDVTVAGTGTIALTGQGTSQAAAEFLGNIAGNTIVVADATASFYDAGVSTYSYTGAFDFADGSGTLSLPLGSSVAFLPIYGFQTGDRIVVRDGGSKPIVAWDQATHQLTIGVNFDGLDITQATLTIEGSYSLSNFAASSSDDSLIVTATDAPPCFARGTRITTEAGEVAVEHLRVGDSVLTRDGSSRPIVWIGQADVDCVHHPEPHLVRPIRICADAFGAGVPQRDLVVSPDHALYVDGVLVPARLLVNHRTIAVAHDIARVSYFHVELPTHDVLFVEGLRAESFLDTGNRSALSRVRDMAGGRTVADRRDLSCAPLLVDAERVEPIWRRLAGADWWPGVPTTSDPALHLVSGHRRIAAAARAGNTHRFEVRGDVVAIASRATRPSDCRPWVDDRRRLGVKVQRIVVEIAGRRVELDRADAAARAGWWADEPDGRWTDGSAELGLPPGTSAVELTVDALDTYVLGDVALAEAA